MTTQVTDDELRELDDPRVRRGAEIESRYRKSRFGKHAHVVELFEVLVETRGDRERAADLAVTTAVIMGSQDPLRTRLRRAWRVVKPVRLSRQVRLYIDLHDWWVGYYRSDRHHHVCVLPTVVVRWRRRS